MTSANCLFELISEFVMCHSPSGVEGQIDALLVQRFAQIGVPMTADAAGNLVAKIPGCSAGALAITAHKDEIGASVTAVMEDGRLKLRNLGGAFPWVYGEGAVDIMGDVGMITGVLSFGSRHVAHGAPNVAFAETKALKWSDAWVETKCTPQELKSAGVRPGSRVVIGKHRKQPLRLGDHIASYTLDNKASLAILFELARQVKRPVPDIYLVATSREEVGAMGGLFFTQRHPVDALIALEIAPVAPEYTIQETATPVLITEDGVGFYDETLTRALQSAASSRGIELQLAVVSGFGSDASIAMRQGHIARGACLGFPTQNTHGYEIAHLGAIENCIAVLEAVCERAMV